MRYSIQQIASFITTKSLPKILGTIEYLVVDTRKIVFAKTTLFFALTTPRNDGHHYIKAAYDLGVKSFIVNKYFDETDYPNANFLKTHDVLKALQDIAAHHRQQFKIPVIGITGSNGKTVVKEWLYELLKEEYNIVRSPRSYNSQIGVPLSVWQMNNTHTLAIFEAGISQGGEMHNLKKIIEPTIGLFTTIGAAHDDGFKNREEKVQQKWSLFLDAETVIHEKDDFYNKVVKWVGEKTFITYGKEKGCTIELLATIKSENNTVIKAIYNNKSVELTIPFIDDASIENCCVCWVTMVYFGYEMPIIQQRILQLQPLEMRMQLQPAINNCTLINDSYTNDKTAYITGLDFFIANAGNKKKVVIVSDFSGLKHNDYNTYEAVINDIKERNIDLFIGIGNEISAYGNNFRKEGINCFFYETTANFIKQYSLQQLQHCIIYLKGARSFEFEKIAKLLQQKTHQTVMEINLNALAYNLKQHQQLLIPGTKTMAMVKAFSYGSGSEEVARVLQFNKVDYLAVAYTDEGVDLRKAGINLPILVLNVDVESFDAIIENNLEPEIYSFSIYEAFSAYLQKLGLQHYPIHLKVNTGMNRLGFEPSDAALIAQKISGQNTMVVKSIFSHLVASDSDLHLSFTMQQQQSFEGFCTIISSTLSYTFIMHLANSAAIEKYPNLQYNMVRLGIGLYGINSNSNSQIQLMQVATLTSTIAQIRRVKKGESVGYNRATIMEKDSIIAVIRIGYADGLSRQLSNGVGKVFLHNQLAPTIGNICMDMTMIDVTNINETKEGDKVEIFGNNLSVTQVAQWCNTIAYETLCTISQRVKRVYVQE